jgi:peptidoglycan hydrolase-like amidase/peptidoglycan hydrolase CwlO-like protein
MKKILYLIILVFIITAPFCINRVYGNELEDINKQLDELNDAYNKSKAATAPLESELNSVKERVAFVEADLAKKKKDIDTGYKNLEEKKLIFDKTVAKNYIESYNNNWFSYLIGSEASEIMQNLAYQKAKADQDKVIITNIALSITDLEVKKRNLENEEIELAAVKEKLDKIVTEAKAYQATLSNKIAVLSARQKEILSQRLSALGIPLFASALGGCSSDIGKDPGFGGAFGFFTYGVPNRVGLNQYGAWGRAKAGQGYEAILRAYYNFDSIENRSATINVEGYGPYSLEDYVKRIYEVPDSWTDNDSAALKAQAIAVRSYALAYTNNGAGSICTTQQCQVFKPDSKGGNWEQAVNSTSGQVMVQGGQPIKAWFSSTHGGYIHSSGDIGWNGTSWTKNAQDTTSGISNFSDLKNNAYDKDSPWFYCDWGSRSDYNKTAWLKPDEVADIINVIMLARADSSVNEHLYQTDKSNPAGTDTWDANRVKTELRNKGITPFNSVSGIQVDVDWGSGKTSTVHVSGDTSDPSISGDFFKTYFNLRAPANIQIVGPLYNVERN